MKPTIFICTVWNAKRCCRSKSHAFLVGGYTKWHLGSFTESRESAMLFHKLVNFISGAFLDLRVVAHQGEIPTESDGYGVCASSNQIGYIV